MLCRKMRGRKCLVVSSGGITILYSMVDSVSFVSVVSCSNESVTYRGFGYSDHSGHLRTSHGSKTVIVEFMLLVFFCRGFVNIEISIIIIG